MPDAVTADADAATARLAELGDWLGAALAVVHLLFTTGHTAPPGPSRIRADLVQQAMHLARMLRKLMPGSLDVRCLRALLLVGADQRLNSSFRTDLWHLLTARIALVAG